MTTLRVGFIGLGAMGTPISTNLMAAGFPVTVYDADPARIDELVARGASPARSVADLAAASDVVLTSLPGPRQVRQVAVGEGGILDSLAPGGTYIDLSTNSPTLVREIGRALAARGLYVLDAPIGGRSLLAGTRDLLVMAAGEREAFERCLPILEAIGKRVIYCGDLGSGMVCKLVHNAINAVFRQVTGECFTLGVKAGVDARVLWDVTRNGITATGSEINRTMRSTWLAGAFDTGSGTLDSHLEDTQLVVELGREYAVPMAHVELTLERLIEAAERGWGRRDSPVSLLLQEERAGTLVRIGDPEPC